MRCESVKQFEQYRKECKKQRDSHPKRIHVCCGPGCLARGAAKIVDQLRDKLKDTNGSGVTVEAMRETGCHGFCQQGPLVVIEPTGTFYTKVKPKHIDRIVEKSVVADDFADKLLYTDPTSEKKITSYHDIDFYKYQTRVALRNLGQIDQTSLSDFIAVGGYSGAVKALTSMTPEQVIDEMSASGLRGRGGGGFPAGRKWSTCRKVDSDQRFVICNGDEGDPGAFMDRAIMEGDPHSVLEGMIICAYAVGASTGYIYVREEYPLAVVHLQNAVQQAEELGLLGNNILDTAFSFTIQINRGGGAFVCGESSALMQSVAGNVGEPRAKYIRSVLKGLHDKPTVLNNVETFANVPEIINRGGKWFASLGTPTSTGTKAFSLVGKVCNTGLIEVPMGTTLKKIIFDIGGGIIDDRPFKAVQTGGPSGGCLPDSRLDLSVDFDTLTEAGSMMGSGGMIVMDDRTCVVDLANYFLGFLVAESCGKCVPCREGLYQLHKLAIKVSEGEAEESDLELMAKLSRNIVIGSLCGLGTSGPNPFLSTVQYFREEYLAHITDKRCPAGVCRALIRYDINDKCTGCMACIPSCAVDAISGKKGKLHILDQTLCDKCGACYAVCQYEAIDVT
ncbi:MAG: NADH-ubiquinone oxidoreductase-F iron-sulfur binding region domain-containing protein [Candidatus Zixiibacteriota bacterium]